MTAMNFDLAPPKQSVDGLDAVPIDIPHVWAKLTADGAASNRTGVATIDFVVGPGGDIVDRDETGRVVGGVAGYVRMREGS